jgi:hypothetical protein
MTAPSRHDIVVSEIGPLAIPVVVIVIQLVFWWVGGRQMLIFGSIPLALLYGLALWLAADKGVRLEQHAKDYGFDRRKMDKEPADKSLADKFKAADKEGAEQKVKEGEAATALQASIVEAMTRHDEKGEVFSYSTREDLMDEIGRVTGWSRANTDRDYDRLTDILDRLQTRVGDEYQDIHLRTGWLMTAQAFLLVGYVQTLNAERFQDLTRQILSTGIASMGALVAFVLTLAIFYGHALAHVLKDSRDAAQEAATEYGVPWTGVSTSTKAHRFGHLATKALPSTAFVAWVALAILAGFNTFERKNQGGDIGLVIQVPPTVMNSSGRWFTLKPSPAFPVGSAKFDEAVKGCAAPAETVAAAKSWLNDVVKEWKNREHPSDSDWIVVVGATDRLPLDDRLRQRFDSNMGLARARAEEIAAMLESATKHDSPEHRLTDSRAKVETVGPAYTPASQPIVPAARVCLDRELSEDRRVRIWMHAR